MEVTKIQRIFRGYNVRKRILPLIMYVIKKYLIKENISYCKSANDGRINSCYDEETIINLLRQKFGNRLKVPLKRHWFDFAIKDYVYGWLPINIKTTTTRTTDNVGNLSLCVQAYTNYELDLRKNYQNGFLSKILLKELSNNTYNKKIKKDYYFLVCNKENNEIIVNSVKGLKELTSNNNNLPFQVCWKNNKCFEYKSINKCIEEFVKTIQKPKPTWKENFLSKMREL